MRAAKIAGLVLVGLVVLVTLALSWVLWTESGTGFAVARARGFLPEGITLGRVDGRLGTRLEVRNVNVELPGMEVEVARLWLEWSATELLLAGRLAVAELGARQVRYRALPTEQPAEAGEPFALPERIDLPVPVSLDRLQVEDVALRTAPDGAPIDVERVLLTGTRFEDSRLTVNGLQVDSSMLTARGSIDATAAGDYPLDARLDWQLELPDYAPLDGTTTVGGSLAALEIDQRLAAPYNTELTARANDLLAPDGSMSIAARLITSNVRLASIQASLPDVTLSLDAEAAGPVDGLDVQATVSGTDTQSRRFLADVRALVEDETIAVEQLSVRQPGREGELTGSGRIAMVEDVSADLSIQWSALRWPLTGAPTLLSPGGRLSLSGSLSDYRLDLDTRLEPVGYPALQVHLSGNGSLQDVAVDLNASAGDAKVQGNVQATWDPALKGHVSLQANDFDPSIVAGRWPGAVDLDLAATADTVDDTLQVTVSRLEGSGRLRDQTLSLTARGRYLDGPQPDVTVEQLTAALGGTRIDLEGRVAQEAQVRWQLASDDLSLLLPDAGGRMSGSGTVSGELPRVDAEMSLSGEGLAYADHRLERLSLEADLDLSGSTDSSIALIAENASLAGSPVRLLKLEGNGRPEDHRLSAMLDADVGDAELGVNGRLEDPWGDAPVWHYTLSQGNLAYAELAPWVLEESAAGRVATDSVMLGRQCWQAQQARLCLAGQRDDQGLAARADLDELSFGYFAEMLPEGVQASGAVSVSARVSQPSGGVLTANADLRTSRGQVSLPLTTGEDAGTDGEPGSERAVIALEPSTMALELDEQEARARAAVNLQHGRIALEAATSAAVVVGSGGAGPDGAISDESLTGTVRLDVPDLAFLSPMLPTVRDLEGGIAGELALSGTLGEPRVNGSLDLADGAVTVPQAGISVTSLALSLEGRGRELALRGSAESGGGRMSLDGRMNLPGEVPTATLNLKGEDFQVVDNADAQVLVSPDLKVDADAERITVSGRLHVPEAEITPSSQAPTAVTVSNDQVLESEQPASEQAPARALHADVRVSLGDEVRFEGFGLTARFEGDVRVRQQPKTPTTATGELRILDGEYRAYGQGLVIDRGRIYFAGGPVTQPALDVRAVRRPEEGILVGAHVQGTLREPTFELFSEPSMTQQEQLSYLVLGRSLEETPDGQESALNRAALAMGVKGGDFLARNIGQAVGLDQIGIETGSGEAGAPSDPNQAALVVGKYLSPKLYVSYGIGLFNPESVLEMQYEFSRNWKLVTQSSGESTGADFLYTVELGGKSAESP